MKTFWQVLQDKEPLLFDGAMGTELYKRGIFINKCFEEANLASPELVRSIHRDYRNAGAEILTTNSWGAGRYKLARYNLQDRCADINRAAVQLARSEAGEACYVAGSVGPLGPRLEPVGAIRPEDARAAFREQIEVLVDAGVDLIILETFGDVSEAVTALKAARDVSGELSVIASLTIDMEGNPLFGMQLEEAMDRIVEAGADVVGLNCSVGPQPMLRAARRMRAHNPSVPLCIEPNAGLPRQIDGRMIYMSTPEYFATYARYYLQEGIRLVGGCCGTTPEHIRAMSASVRQYRAMSAPFPPRFVPIEIAPTQSRSVQERAESAQPRPEAALRPVPFAEKSAFAAKLAAEKMVYTLELVPPSGTTLDSLIEKARRAKEVGIDAINIPDGPRASSRVSTLVTAIMIEQKTGLETILHYTCRDRNLISMQADLLGAQTIGLRNILCITGDPPKLGDYPDATGVFDVDSIGLTRMIYRLNRGFDISGKPIGSPTSFSHGVGVNPGSINFAQEMDRLKKKIDAGAEWAMTQPIFDPALMERFLEFLSREGITIPLIMGVWPLTSLKNALFMKNEIPGIEIPDSIIARMERCATIEAAREEGVAIAREMFDAFKTEVQGVQLSAPFGRIELALNVIGK
jgi:homocysteine S-methyltransferase